MSCPRDGASPLCVFVVSNGVAFASSSEKNVSQFFHRHQVLPCDSGALVPRVAIPTYFSNN